MRENAESPFKSPDESVKLLLDEHFPDSVEPDGFSPGPDQAVVWDSDGPAGFITTWRVEKAIKSFGNFKAPGPDEIRPIILKHLGPKALAKLTNLFRASYLLAYQPLVWRQSRVIFIPKPSKGDYSLPRSFRPITLTSFVMKVMERLILWRIEETTFVERPLSAHQHAFRRQRSTDSALTNMIGYIEKAFQNDEYALVAFLDIKGAFDNVKTLSVVQGMEEKGVDAQIVDWYRYYLENRSVEVQINGIAKQRHLVKGTPQGGVLSPVAWNLIFDLLLQRYDEGWVKAVGFADDAGLATSGKTLSVLASRMQRALRAAEEWGNEHGLTFSPAKTVVVIFSRKHKIVEPPRLQIGGELVPYSDQAKYLGVTLDRKLLWNHHVSKKVQSAKGHLMKLKGSMGKLWGVPPFMTRWLYTGIVRPAFSYGSIVWARVTEKKTFVDKMTKLNRLALLGLGNFRKSTPTAGLEVIAHVQPLFIHIRQEATLAVLRTREHVQPDALPRSSHPRHPKAGHRNYVSGWLQEAGVNDISLDVIPAEWAWKKSFEVDMESFQRGQPFAAPGTTDVYTDGSRVHGLAGYGFWVEAQSQEHKQSTHLGAQFSVFQAEMQAIKAAAEYLSDQFVGKEFRFFVDNQATLLALQQNRIESQLLSDTIRALNHACVANKVTLHWIKAHVGHPGNEEADRLAKIGAEDPSLVGESPLISRQTGVAMVKQLFQEKWPLQFVWK